MLEIAESASDGIAEKTAARNFEWHPEVADVVQPEPDVTAETTPEATLETSASHAGSQHGTRTGNGHGTRPDVTRTYPPWKSSRSHGDHANREPDGRFHRSALQDFCKIMRPARPTWAAWTPACRTARPAGLGRAATHSTDCVAK